MSMRCSFELNTAFGLNFNGCIFLCRAYMPAWVLRLTSVGINDIIILEYNCHYQGIININ